MTADPRLFAHDPQRRWSEAPAPAGWHELRPSPARARSRTALRSAPEPLAAQVTEALPGEALERLADEGEWTWVRTVHDGYLGWARAADVGAGWTPDLEVEALRAHAYAAPRVSAPIVAELCRGARLAAGAGEVVTEEHRRWQPVTLPGGQAGWVQAVVLSPLAVPDPASFALTLLGAPYVWGGRSAWGLDCSGLTQLAYAACGLSLPRDADQQHAALSTVDAPRRGDLAFFPGHVGLMLDGRQMVHANATAMAVSVDTLGEGEYGGRLLASLRGYGRWPGPEAR